ncbi:MAG: phosphonoacetaldehyde reductase [Phycisphaera sp.]|nr:MAG: phosphonoacetaldehyde reductase [Phycisphaera sp.]
MLDALSKQSGSRVGAFEGQTLAFEAGALTQLIADSGMTRPMLVVDRRAVDAAGLREEIHGATRCGERMFDGIEPNPSAELARSVIDAAIRVRADGLVAVGGGSCIDLAKATALGLDHRNDVEAIIRGRSSIRGAAPVIAVPTTAGSGSQATSFGVLYVEGRKKSIDHPALRPAAAVLDHRFIESLPPRLSAVSGLDALCQCIESIWACGATERSRTLATEGGTLMFEYLVAAARDQDPAACQAIMLGAHLSGCAINISRTTAAHAYSYALTQRYGVPHGLAVAYGLGWVAQWNAGVDADSCQHPAGPEAARVFVHDAAFVLGVRPDRVGDAMASLLDALSLPRSPLAAGVSVADLPALARAIDPMRLSNNPRRLTADDVLMGTQRSFVMG